jgi:hypothetical protein
MMSGSIEKKKKKLLGWNVLSPAYSIPGMSGGEIPFCVAKRATCFELYASFFPLYSGKPKADEGPFGLASVLRRSGDRRDQMSTQ